MSSITISSISSNLIQGFLFCIYAEKDIIYIQSDNNTQKLVLWQKNQFQMMATIIAKFNCTRFQIQMCKK